MKAMDHRHLYSHLATRHPLSCPEIKLKASIADPQCQWTTGGGDFKVCVGEEQCLELEMAQFLG